MTVEKHPLILFSGGNDSTFLLYETLTNTDAHVLYVEGNQNSDKVRAELKAREAIKEWLNENTLHRVLSDTKYINSVYASDITYGNERGTDVFNAVTLAQPVSWLMSALYHYNPVIHSCVQLAYLCGDDIAASLTTLQYAWDHLCFSVKQQSVPIQFPLKNYRKSYILENLPKELANLTWVCELPVPKENSDSKEQELIPCGRCIACTNLKIEEYRKTLIHEYK